MDPILELAQRHGLVVIEDCAQAHGARYKGRQVGSMGHAAAFSFCHDKIMTTAGEGGLLVTNSERIWRCAWSYKDHGKSYSAVYEKMHPPGYRWLHESFGTNMRMTEVQAAVGRVALRRLPKWVEIRRRNTAELIKALDALGAVVVPKPSVDFYHSFYKFYVSLNLQRLCPDWTRDRVMLEISSAGVFCRVASCSEIYLEKAFANGLNPAERLPNAQYLTETSFALLVDPTLTGKKIQHTAEITAQVIRAASLAVDLAASA
mgnify:CR=1 FL=1